MNIFLLVGDFFQHTFDTSRDGIVNKSIHNDFDIYKNLFKKMGLNVDTHSLRMILIIENLTVVPMNRKSVIPHPIWMS